MVGLVVVSHSRPLARAAAAMARQMLHGPQARITIAAGLGDTTLGTDATQIVEAITAADQGSGVVVLMDLGSAVLSAELAVELLDEGIRSRVVLCPAPLIEGLMAAAVAATTGAPLHEVATEATGALAGKTSHLAPVGATDADEGANPSAGAEPSEILGAFTIANLHGLHARPAARIVQQIRMFDADAQLRNTTIGSPWVPASSMSKLATLGAQRGHDVEIRVTGRQAREALDHILALAVRRFDESTDLDDQMSRTRTDALGGTGTATPASPRAASPGVGIGPARSTQPGPITVPDAHTENPIEEWRRLGAAIATVRRDIARLRARTAAELGESAASIFDAHLLLLEDPELLEQVRSDIDARRAAAPAWQLAITRLRDQLAALPDPYQQARATDTQAVGDQVLRALLGVTSTTTGAAGVLVAADLTPAEAAELDPAQVTAVVLALGSPRAHNAILLRAKGIPAVVAAGPSVLDIADGTLVAVDGTEGKFVVDPPARTQRVYRDRAAQLAARTEQARPQASAPAVTLDGVEIAVAANIGSAEDARTAANLGADLAGLVRTEFLFMGHSDPPDVDEQHSIYASIADSMGGRRVTLRTLDVGGDKPLDYMPTPTEANPYLGVRGIRLSLAHPGMFADQLLASVRLAHETPVSLMFPMVATPDELFAARELLDEAIKKLGRGYPAGLQVGIMVEIPAAALTSAAFAPHVDFLSIGTNDLTQYALAADRNNEAVADVGNPYHPGVLQLINATCRGATSRATVAVCGEMAADEHAVPLLIGLGVRELSVTPHAVPATKQTIRSLDNHHSTHLATRALAAPNAHTAREILLAAASPVARPNTPTNTSDR